MQGLPRDLLDVCRRLRLSVQVVGDDAVSAAAFGGRWTPDNQMPARLEGPVLQDALKNVLVDGTVRLLEFGDVTVALAPIPQADRATNGAVLLAGRASSGLPELATLATWFAAAFSRSGVISAAAVEIRRLASLVAILDRAAASNSESEIVRAFVEALAVWTDREAWGYLGDVSGEFALHVTLPGSAISRVPVALDKAAIPDGSRFFVVPPGRGGKRLRRQPGSGLPGPRACVGWLGLVDRDTRGTERVGKRTVPAFLLRARCCARIARGHRSVAPHVGALRRLRPRRE